MATLQRPPEAQYALFWHSSPAPIPMNTELVVGDTECVVASLNGATIGVIPPGAHVLHPQSFPFLGPSIDPSSNVTAELWFVRTGHVGGFKFGGPLGAQYDAVAELQVTPRVIGEYSIKVTDAGRFVSGCMGTGFVEIDPIVGWVSSNVMRKVTELFTRLTAETRTVIMSPLLGNRFMDELVPMLGELQSLGLHVQVANYNVSFADEERNALVAAHGAKAAAARRSKVDEMERANAGAAVGASAAVPMVAPPPSPGGPLPYGAAGPAAKSNGGLIVGLGLAGVVVLGGGIATAVHFSRGESNDKSHAPAQSAQHDGKHGKH